MARGRIMFANGAPKAKGRVVKCIKSSGNGMLFRIENEEEKTWYFYNDTTDYNIEVTVTFSADSEVLPAGKTRVEHKPDGDTLVVVVGPLQTERFATGVVRGYRHSFTAQSIHKLLPSEVPYKNGAPTFKAERVYKCFGDRENGLLFRLVNDTTHEWAFYNDTKDLLMSVRLTCAANGTTAVPLGSTTRVAQPESGTQEFIVNVKPLETEVFFRGVALKPAMQVVTITWTPEEASFCHGKPSAPFTCAVKCLQESRGLGGQLYRLIDTHSDTWAFYNDTTEYAMTITMTCDNAADLELLGTTRRDEKRPETSPLRLTLHPLQTEYFIRGHPANAELTYTAECALALGPDGVRFDNGVPCFTYDKAFKCFRNNGNGLLFRLVNSTTGEWAFYNDTTTYAMSIAMTCLTSSKVEPLATTTSTSDMNDMTRRMLEVTVDPLRTVRFLRGDPVDYHFSYTGDLLPGATPAEGFTYACGGPKFDADRIFKCFESEGTGALFLLHDSRNKRWALYNDTADYVMDVKMTCSLQSKLSLQGKTVRLENGKRQDRMEVATRVAPKATVLFIRGEPRCYSLSYSASLANPEPKPDVVDFENGTPMFKATRTFKCFREKGNGLLFRLVDDTTKRWAFYNDTVNFIMVVTMRCAVGSKVKVLGNTTMQTSKDGSELIVLAHVKPLDTALFIEGEPVRFSLSFAADSADRLLANEITYENGRPQFHHDKVFKCFPERRTGLFFRLVNSERQEWAFYNDSRELEMEVAMTFDHTASNVQPLDRTQVEILGAKKAQLKLTVAPLKTERFLCGQPVSSHMSIQPRPVGSKFF